MKLKLDENLSRRAADLIRAAGHDAIMVADQGLAGRRTSVNDYSARRARTGWRSSARAILTAHF